MAYTAGSLPPCPHARTFTQIAEQTIFSKITEHTRPDQFSAAEAILGELRDRLEAQVARQPLFHYPAATGDHWCVRDVYDHAIMTLAGLAAMHQQAVPEPPKQQLISREGIVIDLEDKIRTNKDETHLGTDDTEPDNRNSR
jgi:hypothetical protein